MGFEHFVEQWGYLAIFAGTLVEGEAVVIAGGAMAHKALLSLPVVMLVAFVGTSIADNAWFHVGRRYGTPFIEKSEKWKARTERISRLIQKYGALFVLGYRFIYGIRTITPAFLGASGYPPLKFLILDLLSVAFWSCLFASIGYGVGFSFTELFH